MVSFVKADSFASAFAGDRSERRPAIYERLSSYLLLGTGQSLGVLTPEEARQGVANLTGSAELGAQAGELTAWCDTILYGDSAVNRPTELRELLDDARRLFEALGRVKSSHRARRLADGQGVGPCRGGVEQLAGRWFGPGPGLWRNPRPASVG